LPGHRDLDLTGALIGDEVDLCRTPNLERDPRALRRLSALGAGHVLEPGLSALDRHQHRPAHAVGDFRTTLHPAPGQTMEARAAGSLDRIPEAATAPVHPLAVADDR